MHVRRASESDRASWRELRTALEPERTPGQHDSEITEILQQRFHRAAFVCVEEGGAVLGFAEASRGLVPGFQPGVAGCLDKLGVRTGNPDAVASALSAAVEAWTRDHGCTVLLSAVPESDVPGQALRKRLGFCEARSLVLYSKPASAPASPTHECDPSDEAVEHTSVELALAVPHAWRNERALRLFGHGLLLALGACALVYTDLWSQHPLYGGVLPIVDVLFVIYVLLLVMGRLYHRRTATRDLEQALESEIVPGTAFRDARISPQGGLTGADSHPARERETSQQGSETAERSGDDAGALTVSDRQALRPAGSPPIRSIDDE